MGLPASVRGRGYRLEVFDSLGSTNDEAMGRAREGDPGRLWIRAAQQTGGKGRLGRQWVSPAGNLYASLLLVNAATPDCAPQLGFVAGVALASTLLFCLDIAQFI
jgi:BirA family biotin operon repressor/biotin-[acetyl-CoA-carboxylase] ligase